MLFFMRQDDALAEVIPVVPLVHSSQSGLLHKLTARRELPLLGVHFRSPEGLLLADCRLPQNGTRSIDGLDPSEPDATDCFRGP
jgi:hypothetical protein